LSPGFGSKLNVNFSGTQWLQEVLIYSQLVFSGMRDEMRMVITVTNDKAKGEQGNFLMKHCLTF